MSSEVVDTLLVDDEQEKCELAKRSDIALPLSYVFVKRTSSQEGDFLKEYITYRGRLSLEQTKAFYLAEMERLGWDVVDFSSEQEVLLLCTAIKKQCLISLRSQEQPQMTMLHLFIRRRHIIDEAEDCRS